MLPVKLVRSLVLGETMNNPFLHSDDDDVADDDPHAHDADDEDDDDDDDDNDGPRKAASKEQKMMTMMMKKKNKRRTPLLLFTPTRELISDTFRLAAIARDIGMDFHPTPSLSHLIFSWPSSPSSSSSLSLPSSTPSTSSPFSPSSSSASMAAANNNNRPSVSSTTTTTSSTSALLPNDAVPIPFPSLSTPSASLSLLRYFVSLSKGLFKLVFFNFDPPPQILHPHFNYQSSYCRDSDCSPPLFLFSRVSARRVGSMDEFSRELAGFGWTLFRTRPKPPKSKSSTPPSSSPELVYLFRKKELNRVRARGPGGGHEGECRVRELRLPALNFKDGVPLRILLYILLMTDDVFCLA